MTILNDDQARLLEAYCNALARDLGATPPDDLDPEFAAVARHLAAHTAPEPDAGTLADIRARLLAPQPPDTTHDGWHAETWSARPMAMRMPPPASSPSARMRENTAPPSPMVMRAAPPQTAASLPPTAAPPPTTRPAHPIPAAAPSSYGSAPQPTAPLPAAHAAPSATPARRSSFPTRLVWIVLGTLIVAVLIGILVLYLTSIRP